jgi:NADH-quinone oxidoreductase subunit M
MLIKLKAYQRRYNLNYFIFPQFFKCVQKYMLKVKRKVLRELEDEELTQRDLAAPYLFTFGRYGFYLFLLTNVAAFFFVEFFPFLVSDTIYDTFFFLYDNPLLVMIFSPLFAAVILSFIPTQFHKTINLFSVNFSLFVLLFSIFLLGFFDLSTDDMQFQYRLQIYAEEEAYTSFIVGVDGLSCLLIVLTNFLFSLCFFLHLLPDNRGSKIKNINFFLLHFFIVFAFCALDIILFYIFFEATLIPMFLIIGLFGTRERKIYAAYKLFFYTLFSSLFTLAGLILLFFTTGTGDLVFLKSTFFSPRLQNVLWVLLFISFATKLPMIPFHLWLPEAHVEAPTTGSIILAGVLLKLGGYGFFRFLGPLLPNATVYFMPLVSLLSICAILAAAVISLRQIDLKKIIAYSSIAHMGFVSLGLVCFNEFATTGSVFIMLSHGFVSSALFLCVGFLYDRYKTKLIIYYSSLASVMPIFSSFFFLFLLANISLPSTSGFIGELLVLTGVVKVNFTLVFLSSFSVVMVVCYSLWLFNRLCFGALSTKYIVLYQDINVLELVTSISLVFPIFFLGVYPNFLTEYLDFFSSSFLISFKYIFITL